MRSGGGIGWEWEDDEKSEKRWTCEWRERDSRAKSGGGVGLKRNEKLEDDEKSEKMWWFEGEKRVGKGEREIVEDNRELGDERGER